jgi:hypothetical protein
LKIFFSEPLPPLVLPLVPLAALPQQAQPPAEPAAEKGRALSPVVLDILTVLRESGKPMTTTRILEAMARRQPPMEWSARSVSDYLARMVEDGTLENVQDGSPRGYRLP